MVDLRPLLFINVLLAMLLVTVGLAQLNSDSSDNTDTSIAEAQSIPAQMPEEPEKNITPIPEATLEIAQEDESVAEDETIDESTLFVDKTPATPISKQESVSSNEYAEPVSQPQQTQIITGKLIVTSNVYDDIVLVNGKPYGATRLELNLTPGNYQVEVAKAGYSSWTRQIDIRRGQTQNINAQLEHYTTVNYVNGIWENGVKTGEGRYREDAQLEYNGSFVNGKFHGNGTVRYATGMKYQGQWFEGKMKGKGSLTTAEGDTYVGEMEDNQFNGDGTLTKATGDIYTGYWIDGVLNGQGSLTTKDGLLYVGGFADNLFHGSGSLTYPDGGHYEGSFSNGLFHGKGVEVYADGKKYVGQFIEGLYHGKGEMLNPNGSKITGTFKDGKPFGKATLTTSEGEVFTARSSEPGVCYRLKSYRATECPKLEGW